MPRQNGKAGGRKFDTRLSFKELCRRAGISVKQQIIMRRLIKKGVNIQFE